LVNENYDVSVPNANMDKIDTAMKGLEDNKVAKSVTVNGKGLNTNITLSAADIGADAVGTAAALVAATKPVVTAVTLATVNWVGTVAPLRKMYQ